MSYAIALLTGSLTTNAKPDSLLKPEVPEEDHDLVGDLLCDRGVLIGVIPSLATHEVQQADRRTGDSQRDADEAVEAGGGDDGVLGPHKSWIGGQVIGDQGPVLIQDVGKS